jgi:hypothetical protein
MRQVKITAISFILLLVAHCTTEPDTTNFNAGFVNKSINEVTIQTFFNDNLLSEIILAEYDSLTVCTYNDENFRRLFRNVCDVYSLVIRFSNNRGYLVDDANSGDFNFTEQRNPFLPNGGFEISNVDYNFKITQLDFENAYVLP